MIRGETLLPALGLVAMIGAGSLLLIRPALQERSALQYNIELLQDEIGKPIDEPGLIAALKGEVDRMSLLAETRTTTIPAESDIAGLLRDLSEKLSALGLKNSEVTTGIPQAADGVFAVPVSLHFEGHFLPAVEAIEYIESLPRLIRITRLTMVNPERKVGEADTIKADMMLDVFYDPEDKPFEGSGA